MVREYLPPVIVGVLKGPIKSTATTDSFSVCLCKGPIDDDRGFSNSTLWTFDSTCRHCVR